MRKNALLSCCLVYSCLHLLQQRCMGTDGYKSQSISEQGRSLYCRDMDRDFSTVSNTSNPIATLPPFSTQYATSFYYLRRTWLFIPSVSTGNPILAEIFFLAVPDWLANALFWYRIFDRQKCYLV